MILHTPNGSHKAVTLRFDDGPIFDKRMVGLLNKYHMKATFYLIGRKLMQGSGIRSNEVKKLYNGHEIGNHTFLHKQATNMPLWDAKTKVSSPTYGMQPMVR